MHGADFAATGRANPAAHAQSALGTGLSRLLGYPVAILEAERRNWFLWFPVALAAGVLFYFKLDTEPSTPTALLPLAMALVLRKIMPAGTVSAAIVGLIVTFALGLALAKIRTEWVRAPVLERSTGELEATGIVELIEPKSDTSARVTIWLSKLGDLSDQERPARIRVTVGHNAPLRSPTDARSQTPSQSPNLAPDLSPGDGVRVKVRLLPPPTPAAPGDYDFARYAWFKQLGGVGRAVGPPEILNPDAAGLSVIHSAIAALARIRKAIGDRVRSSLPGETGAIANALITGERTAITEETNEAYRASGLYHILSISGLHMAIMGGSVFFALRFLLALIPPLALRFPIKKWAAIGAIMGAGAYLMISGGAFATVRSFIMITVMFAAILLDRPALALRNVAIAAAIIIAIFPESVLDPGFQMSFAAVIALIAGYDGLSRFLPINTDGLRPGGIASTAVLFTAGIVGSTLLASAAVAPFALYHFHQTQHYAVLANLIAIPACNLIVMPAALATLLALPLGMEAAPLQVMAFGIDVMTGAAGYVSALPGAVGHHPSINETAFGAMVAGGLIWALLSHQTRWLGALVILAGLAWTPQRVPPDILIGRAAETVAARTSSGRLSALPTRGIDYTLSRWLERDGDPREAQQAITQAMHPDAPAIPKRGMKHDPMLAGQAPRATAQMQTTAGYWRCDELGCAIDVSGAKLAVPHHPAAIAEDCAVADIVILRASLKHELHRASCRGPQVVISPADIERAGAHAITVHRAMRTPQYDESRSQPESEPIDGRPNETPRPSGAKTFTLEIDTVAARRGNRPWTKFAQTAAQE